MKKITYKLKDFLRPGRNLLFAGGGFIYDFYRYIKYTGWNKVGADKRDYRAVKMYHSLEKSLSFKNRRATAGRDTVFALAKMLAEKKTCKSSIGYQERIGAKVLDIFVSEMDANDSSIDKVRMLCKVMKENASSEGGVKEYSSYQLRIGQLSDPELFFQSRYSVRQFEAREVEPEIIHRAVKLAMKSPSVCNRQAWHVYHISKRETIDLALSLQNGNKGFGHEVPCLLILAVDLLAFDSSIERYQHWIDGGMFSMSMVMALHSLGLGSCCLNWSKGPLDDIRLHNMIGIKSSHTVLMMIAVGYPDEKFKVCYSARRPINEVYTLVD